MKNISLIVALIAFSNTAWAGTSYTTKPATDITATTAMLNGEALSTLGLAGEIFQYGKTLGYGMTAVAAPQGVNGPVSSVVFDLECETTYHFRFIGESQPPRVTLQGDDMTFTTALCAPQMICSVLVGGSWRDTIHVPDSWDAANCENYMEMVGANAYQLGCIFDNDVDFGTPGSSSTPGGTPTQNCGW